MTQDPTRTMDSEKATDFLYVKSWFPDDPCFSPRIDTIHRDDLELFVKALVRLHVDPGVDPVTKKKQQFLERITVCELIIERNTWSAKPHLGEVAGEKAARRLVEGDSRTVWRHPDYAAEVEADYEKMFAEEGRMQMGYEDG